MYKVALWGSGSGYDEFLAYNGAKMVEIVVMIDQIRGGYYHSIDTIPIITPKELFDSTISFDYLIITVENECTFKEIVETAVKNGIDRDIILPSRIFGIPFFNFDDYIRIKKSKISIISDYCFAGYLYHRFGMKFLSPTINMFADNENYISFIDNIEENIKKPMEEIKNTVDNLYRGRHAYPRGKVGDCEWQFNHDIVFETANERWKKGCERFNENNYIVIMTIMSEEMAYRFDSLPIEYKIGFYWKELNLNSVICLPEWNDPSIRAKFGYQFSGLVNRVAQGNSGTIAVNWMKALLHEKEYRRMMM